MMKRLLAFGAVLMLVLTTACDQNGKGDGKISIIAEISGDVVNIIYTSDNSKMEIVYGVVAVEELGGKDITVYVSELLSSGNALTRKGLPYTYSPDIAYLVEYCAYAAEISNGAVVGDVYTESVKNVKSYMSYMPEEIVAAPAAISDNGRYLVSSIVSLENSVILDVVTETETILDGITLYDITDDGKVAFGQEGTESRAAKYENGEISILDNSATGTIFAITPDGKMGAGYLGSNAVKYENGTLTRLSFAEGKGIEGGRITSGIGLDISTNGIVVGYVNDDDISGNLAAYWTPDGKLNVIGEKAEKPNSMDRETEAWFVYGGWANEESMSISPNGKYIAGTVYDAVGFSTKLYPYVLNTETGELHVASVAEFEQYNEVVEGSEYSKHPRVDAVTNEGEVIMTVTRGGESDKPYVYTIDGGMSDLQSYLEKKFGVKIEPEMTGSCACVSANGRSFVLAHQVTEGYMTEIYSF